jgi:hypothetical protein
VTFDSKCVRCGSILKHLGSDSGNTDLDTLHHHYRCPASACDADGGTVVTCDGVVTRVVGPAVDATYTRTDASGRPARDDGSLLATDGGHSEYNQTRQSVSSQLRGDTQ